MPAALRLLAARLAPRPTDAGWDLSAEAIAVKIRWFGLVVGGLVANWGTAANPGPLNAILLLGLGFTAVDTMFYLRGRLFLRDFPVLISVMEALFIGLLCHFEGGPDSPFRFYYLLSLICSAMRYPPRTTLVTCVLDGLSYAAVTVTAVGPTPPDLGRFLLMLVILGWVTWAAGAMARLLKRAGDELRQLNAALRENQSLLESRIAERSRELEETQAQVLHQEKMAAFGLLAAGIAHEVGNPLTSISAVVQMLEHRNPDTYTRDKLGLVTGQLARIQSTLRELVTFSRPASDQRARVAVRDVIDEALGIAKYYKGGKTRQIDVTVPANLPPLAGVRDQFVQVVFNLVLNAIDATGKSGKISVSAGVSASGKSEDRVLCLPTDTDTDTDTFPPDTVTLTVKDDGAGIDPIHRERLFRPYFTTKRHGTGLGLFVVRRIVEQHGGTVDVESEPGRGTTFRVTLPVAPVPVAAVIA
ncbi:MAG: sensor histidine kinase [Fimbriiglobus sp.]